MKLRSFLSLALLAASLTVSASLSAAPLRNTPGRFAPRDECARVPGAAAFRAALASAVQRRDADALVALAAADVTLDFGGGSGKAELRKRLRGAQAAELWRELAGVLALGCAVQERQLVLPWFFAQDLGDTDPFEVWLVAGTDVQIFPSESAIIKPIGRLSWQLVKPVGNIEADAPFQHVQIVGGELTGYVPSAMLRSQIGYRLVAKRVGRNWRIGAFIAGD